MPSPGLDDGEAVNRAAFAYPATFWRALWAYPAIHAALSLAIIVGRRDRIRTDDARRAVYRDSAQWALKLVSSLHAIVATYMATTDLSDSAWTRRNLIQARSEKSNAAVGLEAGYLLQDTIVSMILDSSSSPVRLLTPSATSPYKVRFSPLMRYHHVILGGLLTLFLEYARHARDKGVFFVEGFVLMNASTPFLNLRWMLRRFRDQQKSTRSLSIASAANEATLIATFFACRIGLIFYMLRLYGIRTKRSIIASYLSIPAQCKTGTALLVVLNLTWWLSLVRASVKTQKTMQSR